MSIVTSARSWLASLLRAPLARMPQAARSGLKPGEQRVRAPGSHAGRQRSPSTAPTRPYVAQRALDDLAALHHQVLVGQPGGEVRTARSALITMSPRSASMPDDALMSLMMLGWMVGSSRIRASPRRASTGDGELLLHCPPERCRRGGA